jgi:hypothetical protein
MQDMKTRTLITIAALAMMSGTALASSSDCNEPKDKWMSMDEARAKVVSMGYDVRKIKVEDGCYEAYATRDGKKLEIYMNPVTAEVVKMKEDD